MEKNVMPLKVDFKIENPTHGNYKTGVLAFVFDKKTPSVLNRIDFDIDGQKYFVNLLRLKRCNLTWIFQKERSLNALNSAELDKVLCLANDIVATVNLRLAYKNILRALPKQADIYLKLMDKSTTKEEKEALLDKLKSKNTLLKNAVATPVLRPDNRKIKPKENETHK